MVGHSLGFCKLDMAVRDGTLFAFLLVQASSETFSVAPAARKKPEGKVEMSVRSNCLTIVRIFVSGLAPAAADVPSYFHRPQLGHGERSDGPGLPPPPDDGFPDAPLTVAGLFQARCTAAALKTLIGPLSVAVVSSPARRCLQTARPIAEALQAALYVEPGLADWSQTSRPVQATLPELGLEVLGPVLAEPPEEETWEMAVRRYGETYAGLVSSVSAVPVTALPATETLVLCSHQAALEALAPASWTQGHCAVTELSGIPPVPGSLLHDCSAWRLRFVFVASREPQPRYWRANLGTAATTRPLESHGDFWSVAAADAHLTLTSSKRERPLLLFLDVTGELIHLSGGLAVSASEAGELTLAKGAQRLRWASGPGGELLLNEKGLHVAVRNGEMPTLWMKEGSSDDSVAFDLVPLGKAGP
eukprot:s1594_g13.t7